MVWQSTSRSIDAVAFVPAEVVCAAARLRAFGWAKDYAASTVIFGFMSLAWLADYGVRDSYGGSPAYLFVRSVSVVGGLFCGYFI
jgi:hypothetical protein